MSKKSEIFLKITIETIVIVGILYPMKTYWKANIKNSKEIVEIDKVTTDNPLNKEAKVHYLAAGFDIKNEDIEETTVINDESNDIKTNEVVEVIEEYEEPVYEEPVYEEPTYVESVYEEPVYEEPVYVEPEPVYYNPNTISINGITRNYYSIGPSTTDTVQQYLNNGYIVGSLTHFSPTDGQTTYFSGHNPGAFNFMANNIGIGSIITVTDYNGNPTNYTAIDSVYVDTNGYSTLSSIGISARELYNCGSYSESIAIQYCIGNTMIVWYCIPC